METIRHIQYKARKKYKCDACNAIDMAVGCIEFMEMLNRDEVSFYQKVINRNYIIEAGELYDYYFIADGGECSDYRAIKGMTELCHKYDIFEN